MSHGRHKAADHLWGSETVRRALCRGPGVSLGGTGQGWPHQGSGCACVKNGQGCMCAWVPGYPGVRGSSGMGGWEGGLTRTADL